MLLCRHVKVEGLQVISKSRCKLFDGCYCIYCFICWVLFSMATYGAFSSHDFRLFHQLSRCCCFLTFLWISSLKLQTLPSAFWTAGWVWEPHPDGFPDPLTLAGWILFPVGVMTKGHHFTSSSWTACPICRNSRQMIPGWCESVEHRNVRCNV